MHMDHLQRPGERELADYLWLLWDRKSRIIVGTFIVMALVFGVSMTLPPVYETSLNLKIGHVWGNDIESPHLLAGRLRTPSFMYKLVETVQTDSQRNVPSDEIVDTDLSAKVLEGGTNQAAVLVTLSVRSKSPEMAVTVARSTAQMIMDEHRVKFEEHMKQRGQYEKDLEVQVEKIKKDADGFDKLLKNERGATPSIEGFLYLQTHLEQKYAQLFQFMKEYNEAKINNVTTLRSENTKITDPPYHPKSPTSPKVLWNTLIAGVIGLVCSVLAVFLGEYLNNARNRMKRSETLLREQALTPGNGGGIPVIDRELS